MDLFFQFQRFTISFVISKGILEEQLYHERQLFNYIMYLKNKSIWYPVNSDGIVDSSLGKKIHDACKIMHG